MQRPPDIFGVKLGDLIKASSPIGEEVLKEAEEFHMQNFIDREINVGFSGGEIKRSEILQLTAQRPDFILLDEPESGVDIQNIDLIGKKVHDLLFYDARGKDRHVSSLVITHTGQIMDYIEAQKGYVMKKGVIVKSGEPMQILKHIRENGYGE